MVLELTLVTNTFLNVLRSVEESKLDGVFAKFSQLSDESGVILHEVENLANDLNIDLNLDMSFPSLEVMYDALRTARTLATEITLLHTSLEVGAGRFPEKGEKWPEPKKTAKQVVDAYLTVQKGSCLDV